MMYFDMSDCSQFSGFCVNCPRSHPMSTKDRCSCMTIIQRCQTMIFVSDCISSICPTKYDQTRMIQKRHGILSQETIQKYQTVFQSFATRQLSDHPRDRCTGSSGRYSYGLQRNPQAWRFWNIFATGCGQVSQYSRSRYYRKFAPVLTYESRTVEIDKKQIRNSI